MNLTLKSCVVFVALSFSTLPAWSAAGRVQFSTGEVIVAGADGIAKPLSKGTEFNSGDTIQTLSGRAQLRFTDGGFVSLQPNTQFKVDEYAYEGNAAAEGKNFFTLLKGGMRAITGLVGKSNKEAYRVNTPVATIGIRGTEYLAEFEEKLLVKVGDGAVYISNLGGDIILYPGQVGEVTGDTVKPQYSTEEPSVNAAAPSGASPEEVQEQAKSESENANVFSLGEVSDPNGNPCVITADCAAAEDLGIVDETPVLVTPIAAGDFTGRTFTVFYENDDGFDELGNFAEQSNQLETINVDAAGNLLSVTNEFGTFTYQGQTLDKGSLGGGGFGAFGGGISWARLNNGQFTSQELGSTSLPFLNSHVIFGAITPINDPSIANTTATYNFVGGTSPTDAAGNLGTVNSASLDVDFNTAIFVFNMNLTMNSGPGAGNYIVVDRGEVFGNQFNSIDSGQAYTVTGPGCEDGFCIPTVDGFFSGSDAIRAGLTYIIEGTAAGNDIVGAAAFVKSGLGPNLTSVPFVPPSPFLNTYNGPTLSAGFFNGLSTPEFNANVVTINSDVNFDLVNSQNGSALNTFSGSTLDKGFIGAGAFNGASGLSWARLTGSSVQTDLQGNFIAGEIVNNEHVIFGQYTPANDPVFSGASATYSFAGGTSPTDGAGNLGSVTSGSLSVNFVSSALTANIAFNMSGPGAGSYNVVANGSISAPVFSGGGPVTGTGCPNGCSATIDGFFNGAGAANAGLIYKVTGSTAVGDIAGAAGFVKSGL